MSETVSYTGKIKKVATGEPNAEQYSRLFFKNISIEYLPNGYTSFTELIHEYNHELINGDLYHIVEKKELTGGDMFVVNDLGNNEYEFIVQYYNGGCCFSEAIEQGFKNLNNNK